MFFSMDASIRWFKTSVVDTAISFLGYPVIDWAPLFAQYGLNEHNAIFDVAIQNNAWKYALPMVRNTLMQRTPSSWACELNALENAIMELITIRTQEIETADFNEDFKIFIHFVFLSLNQENLAPAFPSESLTLPHTQNLLQCLITYRFQALPEIRSVNTLLQQNDELNALVHLVRPLNNDDDDSKNTLSTSYAATFIYTLSNWFNVLVTFLKKCLFSDSSSSECLYEYAKVASSLWDIGVRFELNDLINNPEIRSTLYQAYQRTIERMQDHATPNIDEFLTNSIETNDSEPFSFNLRYILSDLNKAYKPDFESLTHWGESHYRRAILMFQSGSQDTESQSIENYLTAYQITHQYIERLSARLYHFRNKLEETLRANPAYYCDNVDFLNAKMLEIESHLIELQRSLLKQANTLTNNSTLSRASECLDNLLTPAVHNLNQIAWVEHTAYCSALTEERFAFEMQQRRHIENYNLETTQTQSDYTVYKYWQELYREARPILARIHPDKFQSTPALLPIARFCTEQIVKLRERAEKVRHMWGFSQWYDVSRRATDELSQEDERLTCAKINNVDDTTVSPDALETKIEVPLAPDAPLTLNILRLNEHYQVWAAAEASLEKRTRRVEAHYSFYCCPYDPFEIAFFNLNKQQYPAKKRRMNHLDKELEKSEAQYRESEARYRETLDTHYNVVRFCINKQIKEELNGNSFDPDVILNAKSHILAEISEMAPTFSPEVINQLFEQCFNVHLKKYQETSHASNPAVFFAMPATDNNAAASYALPQGMERR